MSGLAELQGLGRVAGKMIAIFRAGEAKGLLDVMSFAPLDEAQDQGLKRMVEAGYQDGAFVRVVFSSEVLGMSLTYAWFKPGYPLPRHSHNADCLYYIISGEIRYGAETLGAGDAMHVPGGALYTFETGENGVEFVEFRAAARYDIAYQASARSWNHQLEELRNNAPAWASSKPPPAVRRMRGEA